MNANAARLILAAALLIAAAAACHRTHTPVITLSVHNTRGADHPIQRWIETIDELLARQAPGVVFRPALEEMTDDLALLESLQRDRYPAALVSASALSQLVEEFQLSCFPYLFDKPSEAAAFYLGPQGNGLLRAASDSGILAVAFFHGGTRCVAGVAPPRFAGETCAAAGAPLVIAVLRALGLEPQPAGPYQGGGPARNGAQTIDTDLVTLQTSSLAGDVRHVAVTQHLEDPLVLVLSAAAWAELKQAGHHEKLRAIARETAARQWEKANEQHAAALNALTRRGVEIDMPDIQLLRERAESVYRLPEVRVSRAYALAPHIRAATD